VRCGSCLLSPAFNSSDPRLATLAYNAFQHLGTAFQVETGGLTSDIKHRYGYTDSAECVSVFNQTTNAVIDCQLAGQTCIVVPFHTIVIKLDQGVIQEIAFDDDDSLCNNAHSVDGNCAVDLSSCTTAITYGATNTSPSTDCDFKVSR
jgi:hypothetical protein